MGKSWISRRAVVALVGIVFLAAATLGQFAAAQPATVRLVIDYGDGVIKTIVDLPWTKGSTVLDVMNAARVQVRPHGIDFKFSGSGSSAFLEQIDDVKNEGGGSGKKNWQFWVNTSYADRSFGVYEVQALDVVFWRFAPAQVK
jgi:hypothetical protein